MNRQDNLANRILEMVSERLPEGMGDLGHDLRTNLSTMLKDSFARMDLVTREEFEIQQKVLNRTRLRLETLEAEVKKLEQQLSEDSVNG